MPTRLLLAASLCLAGTACANVTPAAPDTRSLPRPAPLLPQPRRTVGDLLTLFPGTWSGEQRVISPAKTVMTVQVTETYRLVTENGKPVLLGDIRYTTSTGDKSRTFHGSSRTWVAEDGSGLAEVIQDGKTEKFTASVSADSLIFLPVGKIDEAQNGTGVRVVKEGDTQVMLVRGFQKSPQGVFVIEGRLQKQAPQ